MNTNDRAFWWISVGVFSLLAIWVGWLIIGLYQLNKINVSDSVIAVLLVVCPLIVLGLIDRYDSFDNKSKKKSLASDKASGLQAKPSGGDLKSLR